MFRNLWNLVRGYRFTAWAVYRHRRWVKMFRFGPVRRLVVDGVHGPFLTEAACDAFIRQATAVLPVRGPGASF